MAYVLVRNDDGQAVVVPNGFAYLAPSSGHAFFDYWRGHPACLKSWALRSQAELDGLVQGPPSGKTLINVTDGLPYRSGFTYDPADDAAIFWSDRRYAGLNPSSGLPQWTNGLNALQRPWFRFDATWFPVGSSLLLMFDWRWDQSFRDNYGEVVSGKAFRFQAGGHDYWTLMDYYSGTPADVAARHTDELSWGTGTPVPTGDVSRGLPVGVYSDGVNCPGYPAGLGRGEGVCAWGPGPAGLCAGPGASVQRPFGAPNGHTKLHSIWTRIWIEWRVQVLSSAFSNWNRQLGVTVQPNPNDPSGQGRWDMRSVWMGDRVQGIRRLLHQMPGAGLRNGALLRPSAFFPLFSSSKINPTGHFSGAMRNVNLLRDYILDDVTPEADTALFTLEGL